MKLYQVLDTFFRTYLRERQIEGTLALVTDDVYSIGTGEKEIAVNKTELERLLRMEMTEIPGPIHYQILDYREKEEGQDCRSLFLCGQNCDREGNGGDDILPDPVYGYLPKGRRQVAGKHAAYVGSQRSPGKGRVLSAAVPFPASKKHKYTDTKAAFGYFRQCDTWRVIGRYLEAGFPLYVVNDTMLEMVGYTYEEFVQAIEGQVVNSIYDDDAERVSALISEKMKTGSEYVVEYRIKKRTGDTFGYTMWEERS